MSGQNVTSFTERALEDEGYVLGINSALSDESRLTKQLMLQRPASQAANGFTLWQALKRDGADWAAAGAGDVPDGICTLAGDPDFQVVTVVGHVVTGNAGAWTAGQTIYHDLATGNQTTVATDNTVPIMRVIESGVSGKIMFLSPAGDALSEAKTAQTDLATHEARTDNPHSVTAAQVGAHQTVDTVTDLLSMSSVPDESLVQTRGYAAVGDSGANLYRYDAGSSATCDGGFVLDGIGGSNALAATQASYAGTGTGRFIAVDQSRVTWRQFGLTAPQTPAARETALLAVVSGLDSWTVNQRPVLGNSNPPSAGNDPSVAGEVTWDENLLWVRTATAWKKVRLESFDGGQFTETFPFDPPQLADGSGHTEVFAMADVRLGDLIWASFDKSLEGVLVRSYVESDGNVAVRFQNESGQVVNLPSGTVKIVAVAGDAGVPFTPGEYLSDTAMELSAIPSLEDGVYVKTAGYYTILDGGGNTYRYDAGSSAACDGGFVLDGIGGDNSLGATQASYTGTLNAGRFIAVDQTVANAKQFGAKGDGVSDDAFRLQAAAQSGAPVKVPPASYVSSAPMVVASGEIDGKGAEIDFSTLDPGLYTDPGAIRVVGSSSLVGVPSADVLKGDSTITFASPPSVDPGDLIAIKDADDFSFSAFRDYYRKGEFAKVASVSGNVVSVYGVIQDDYLLSGSIEVYKITPVKASISGLSIVGPTIANGWGVYVSFSEGAAVENLNIKGVARTALAINQSSGVRISNCSVGDDAIDANGTDYGIQISGCQDALISNCSGYAVRHAFTTGGTDGIVNRNIRVVGGSYNSISNAVTAFDFHGNTLDSSVDGAKINGGAALSGDFISMVNCNVIGDTQNLQAVLFDEMVGHTHSVTGCKITSRSFFSNRGSCLYFVPTAETAKGGQIICSSNTFIIEEPTSGEDVISVRLANTAFTGAEEIQFTASGNSFDSVGDSVAIQVYEGLGNASYRVQISGNNCNRSSIAKVWTASGLLALKNVNITGNICERGAGEGVHIRGALNSLVSGNLISESEKTPIYIEGGNDANRAESCKVIGNSFSNCVRANLGTGSVNSDKSSNVWLRYHDKIHISENIGGSRYIKLFVTSTAGFAPGDIITGGTSGATAVLDNIETDDSLMVLMDRGSAPFTNTETISNGAGGSETLNANQETVQKLFAVRDALHLWHSANFDPEANLGEALTNVTNNNPY